MAAPASEITHGTLLATKPVDETGLLVTKTSEKYTREHKQLKGAVTQAWQKWRARNPLLVVSVEAAVSALSGFAVAAAGSAVTTFANFAATTRTIDPAVGTKVMGDIEDEHDRDPDLDCYFTTKFDVTHCSFIV